MYYCFRYDRGVLVMNIMEKSMSCTLCEKRFFAKNELIIHKRSVHEKQKRFQCEMCDYQSFYKGNVQKHQETHRKRDEGELANSYESG